MAAQRQELAIRAFDFNAPTSLSEAQEYATIFASSGLCPERFRGKPNDVLIVIQTGKEMGLSATQSLRCLYVVNGMPAVYGDGLLALVRTHKLCEDIKEWFEGEMSKGTLTAFCTVKRKGCTPSTASFSIEDAKRAGLWQTKDNWKKYPQRMLMWRARGYAGKDAVPEAFFNLLTEDELDNLNNVVEIKQVHNKGMRGLEESLGIDQDETVIEGQVISPPPESEPSKLDELKELISRMKVTKGSITVTLKKCGVETIEELSDEQIDVWSNHLKSKEKQ